MQAPTTQQVPSVGIGSRLADYPMLSGPRQGESAAIPVKVEPRPERRAFPISFVSEGLPHAAHHE